jgi:hypothetical protein
LFGGDEFVGELPVFGAEAGLKFGGVKVLE